MTFSPELEARFEKFLAKYPADRKRSAMIPMLIYAQDEIGAVTDELIEEMAKRTGVTPLQVNEVVGYYSMLHRKPHGQVSRAGLHQYFLSAGGRRGTVGAGLPQAGHRPQASHGGRARFARRSGMHGRMLLGAGRAGELRFLSRCDAGAAGQTARRPARRARRPKRLRKSRKVSC